MQFVGIGHIDKSSSAIDHYLVQSGQSRSRPAMHAAVSHSTGNPMGIPRMAVSELKLATQNLATAVRT